MHLQCPWSWLLLAMLHKGPPWAPDRWRRQGFAARGGTNGRGPNATAARRRRCPAPSYGPPVMPSEKPPADCRSPRRSPFLPTPVPALAADLFEQHLEGITWRAKPSKHIVANTHAAHSALQRFLAQRMGAPACEVDSSHVRMLSAHSPMFVVIPTAVQESSLAG